MPKLTAAQATSKWSERASAATSAYTEGIGRVTESPGVAAAAKQQKWFQALQASQDKWASRLRELDVAEWKKITTELGGPRFSQGVQAKKGKYESFASAFFPYLEQGQSAVSRMPDTTFEERVQKSVQMMRHNHEFKRS
ncbi:MAG: hypothetical protein ACRDX8_12885 [Acidimicrobiales bacterium]